MLCGLFTHAQIPTRSEFISVCDSLGVHHPNVVWAQARLESGNFKSVMYNKKHNCLGIYDSKRKEYARFDNWIECVKAYRDRVQYKCKTTDCTDEEYLRWITDMGYAANGSYYDYVLSIMRSEEKKNKK